MKNKNSDNHVYKLIELTGTSPVSIEKAIEGAIRRASRTIKKMSWFEVIETRGSLDRGKVQQWQVTLKIGFLVVD